MSDAKRNQRRSDSSTHDPRDLPGAGRPDVEGAQITRPWIGGAEPPGSPRLPRVYIPRSRLWEQLDQATQGPLTVLVAPAGAGKTLGVSGWLRASDGPLTSGAIWLEGDDPFTPDHIEGLLRLADSGPAPGDVATSAPNTGPYPGSARGGLGLERSTTENVEESMPRLLIIDDAHLLPSSTVMKLDERLTRAPQTMRMLLLTRWDLPLNRLVPELLGNLTILRGQLLRLTAFESAQLITEHAHTHDPEIIRLISERVQGWCGAVVLAARTVGAAMDPLTEARRLAAEDTPVGDLVVGEVFSTLTSRQRHVLLCVASEGVVSVGAAAHLSHEPNAGQVLAELEATGLLVTRVQEPPLQGSGRPATPTGQRDGARAGGTDVRFRIHPLLAEVVRRRLAAGGVDVEQARATVVRAANLDVETGRIDDAYRQLAAVGAYDEVAHLISTHGVHLVLKQQSHLDIADLARSRPELVDGRPDLWFPLALERWLVGDMDGARHWSSRVLGDFASSRAGPGLAVAGDGVRRATESGSPGHVDQIHLAWARLCCALLGLEPMYAAVGYAKRAVAMASGETAVRASSEAAMPALLALLGVAQNWLGDLAEAEVNLTSALGSSRARGLKAFAVEVQTHLAATQFMAGREHACVELAREAQSALSVERASLAPVAAVRPMQFTASRASLMRQLGVLQDVAHSPPAAQADEVSDAVHPGDRCTKFWSRMLMARTALLSRSPATAEQALATVGEHVGVIEHDLPDHLHTALLLERALVASVFSDGYVLATVERSLDALKARGEASFVAGLRADIEGDPRRAAEAFETSAADTVYSRPPTRALALACQAQVLDALGESEAALGCLNIAAVETEVRRNALPFLGWTRQGTPMRALLARLCHSTDSAWVRDLYEHLRETADILTSVRATTATPRERVLAGDALAVPHLSPREREVLAELARGATYADIAATLFVSENTVKTHVSSLYMKLSATRRSEALAKARTLNLL